MYNTINGHTKILGIIGDPVEHSLSPQIHNTICKELKLNYVYIPYKIASEDLEDAVKGFRAVGITGFNVTIPHKNHIIKYLDEVSDEALLMGAVNTVKNVNGRLFGYNTDGNGFIKSFKSRDVSVKDKNIVIMGAGGSVRGISVKMAVEGAKSITILNRTLENAQEICDIINDNIGKICRSASLDMATLEEHSKSCDILINTTPVGMSPYINECPVEHLDFLTSDTVVCDLIYNPEETMFLSRAKERGCKIINGWGMLLYQAIDSFQIWTDVKVNSQLIEILQKINKK